MTREVNEKKVGGEGGEPCSVFAFRSEWPLIIIICICVCLSVIEGVLFVERKTFVSTIFILF